MPTATYAEASRQAIAEEMRRDLSVYLFGEDVALGGPMGTLRTRREIGHGDGSSGVRAALPRGSRSGHVGRLDRTIR